MSDQGGLMELLFHFIASDVCEVGHRGAEGSRWCWASTLLKVEVQEVQEETCDGSRAKQGKDLALVLFLRHEHSGPLLFRYPTLVVQGS
mmetsp:Transcript_23492/g.47671  ORF Transcript_23492/g.47671 Transcript_23492/m.47671 type:complete len:89 (+) Transcript_23492:65-331(+)